MIRWIEKALSNHAAWRTWDLSVEAEVAISARCHERALGLAYRTAVNHQTFQASFRLLDSDPTWEGDVG
jgi:hypothetical protein